MSAAPNLQTQREWPERVDFVCPESDQAAKQDMLARFGVNATTTAARGISMLLTVLEPGGCSNCHMHVDSESALYVLEGSARFFYGEHLEHDQLVNAGDFIYVPPLCLHKVYNLSRKMRVTFVIARTDALEQERVVVRPEADDGSAQSRVEYID